MLVYVYDGSFQGLLSAIYDAYYSRKHPDRMEPSLNLQSNLMDSYEYMTCDIEKANKVYCSIHDKISEEALGHVYNCFLSECENVGTLIYKYLAFGWKVGGGVDQYLADDRVFKVHEISQRVEYERHKMLGFVRFKLLEGNIYYSPVRPDNNIIELLAPHFAERLADQNWIIHDVRRNIAVLYNRRNWLISDFTVEKLPKVTNDEIGYQKLWKEFFNTIAIAGRFNPKLQRQFMPRRYWSYLTEKT
jgi:probable DNA metabolism protein